MAHAAQFATVSVSPLGKGLKMVAALDGALLKKDGPQSLADDGPIFRAVERLDSKPLRAFALCLNYSGDVSLTVRPKALPQACCTPATWLTVTVSVCVPETAATVT